MSPGLINRAHLIIEHGASAALGAAVAYAAYAGLGDAVANPQLAVAAATPGVLAWLVARRVLNAIAQQGPQFGLGRFDLPELEPFAPDELLLTEADRFNPELILTDADRLDSTEPLDLDDILAEIGPESRVVRLFDRKAMPTPGQLRSRIDHHLDGAAAPAQADDSHALSEALAELRRSLR